MKASLCKRVLTISVLSALVLGSSAATKETFDEQLTVWPMQNGFSLLEFDYKLNIDFTKPDEKINQIDKFPRQLYDLVRKTDGDVRRIETHQVQGRWHQALMHKVMGYQEEESSVQTSRDLQSLDRSFTAHEPGFSLTVDSIDSLKDSDVSKIFGQIGTLLSVAIYEQRRDAIEIKGASHPDQFFTTEDIKQRKTTYLSKPYESFCQENLSFLLKHFNETVWNSGLHTLYSSDAFHDTHYKEVSMVLEKVYPAEGGTMLQLHWKIAYVTKQRKNGNPTFKKLLSLKRNDLVHCISCDSSTIKLVQQGQVTKTLYSLDQNQALSSIPLEQIWDGQMSDEQKLVPASAWLSSERYVSDLSFARDATFFHILKNGHPTQAFELTTQDYLRDSMRPFMHQLTIRVRFFGDSSTSAKFVGRDNYSVSHEYIRADIQSDESLITISELVIPPQAELIITFGIKKSMIQFEAYTNDPQRGFNVMAMPVLYREFTKKSDTDVNQVQTEKPWKSIDSPGLLIQVPEPDFSMVFNVNGVTMGLIGIFMVNMYNSLVKPKRFL